MGRVLVFGGLGMMSESSSELEPTSIQAGIGNLEQDKSEFASLVRRYRALTWSTSVKDQRERSELQAPLMKLYFIVHPESRYQFSDDFDMILRTLPKGA
jgi:hypothetical protein